MTDNTALRRQAVDLARIADPDTLTRVFYGGGAKHSDELRAMVVHELALAGHDVATHPVVGRWATRRHWRHHGLGWLPLGLADFETQNSRSPGWEGIPAERSTPIGGRHLEVVETTTVEFATRAGRPFAHWVQHSNGTIDAHEYLADGAVGDHDLRDIIVMASPAFLAGGDLRHLRAIRATLGQIWDPLYQAASGTSAYGPPQGGAYGRLYAWHSIAALCGASSTATADEVATRARTVRWFTLDVTSTWFWDPWWGLNVTLACIGPEPERVVVLAATDTD